MAANGPREWLVVYLKGLCMGMADSVPGVSGGTIALIVGIYERLITAIAGLDPHVLAHVPRLHRSEGRKALARELIEMDVPFLLALGSGMVTAVVLMATLMNAAIHAYEAQTAAFFFGLIAAAAIVLYRYVSLGSPARIGAALVGFGLAVIVSGFTRNGGATPPLLLVFVGGALAISAMVLPGVSGAFILYMLGQYEYMTGQLKAFIAELSAFVSSGDPSGLIPIGTTITVFMVGAVVGLLTITHIVKHALANYRQATLTFLVSLMVGSLRAPLETIAGVDAELTPLLVGQLLVAAVVGGGLVIVLDRYTDDIDFTASDRRPPRTETETSLND